MLFRRAVAKKLYFYPNLAGDISGRLGDKLGANRFGELWGVHVSGTLFKYLGKERILYESLFFHVFVHVSLRSYRHLEARLWVQSTLLRTFVKAHSKIPSTPSDNSFTMAPIIHFVRHAQGKTPIAHRATTFLLTH